LSSVSLMKWRPALGEPQTQKLLTLLEDATVLMEDHAVIRVRDDTGLRVDPGDGLVHAMQGYQGQQGGNHSPDKVASFFSRARFSREGIHPKDYLHLVYANLDPPDER